MMRLILLTLLSISLRTFADDYDGGEERMMQTCPDNTTFGDNCLSKCHCRVGDACHMVDGSCPNGCVGPQYKPGLCQHCTEGYFGPDCLPCHCLEGKSVCNTTTGSCQRGGCSIGYEGAACQTLTGYPRTESMSVASVVSVNESFLAACSAEGAPPPNITITSSNLTIADPGQILDDSGTLTLTMYFNSSLKGEFEIICEAFNEHGRSNMTSIVLVVDPPVLIDGPVFHGDEVSSINVSWSKWRHGHDEGGVAVDEINLQYLVVYRVPGHTTWLDNGDVWHNETSAVIVGLNPDSEYEIAVRIRRVGSEDEGRLGPYAQWYTKCLSPNDTFVPYNFTAHITSPSSARLSWLAPTRQDFICQLESFILSYELSGTPPLVVDQQVLTDDQLEYNVSGLQPQSKYTFYLKATTSAGNDTKTAELTIDPSEFVPGPVTNVQMQKGSATELHLSWSLPDHISPSEEKYINYTVTVTLTSIGACDSMPRNAFNLHSVSTKNRLATFFDLYPFSNYKVSVEAQTVFGQHGQLVNLTADTPESAPTAAVSNIRLVEHDTSKLGYEWDPLPCDKANGRLSYRYVLRKIDQSSRRRRRAADDVVANGTTTATNVTFDNLTPSTTYQLSVSGSTAAGEGPANTTAKQTAEVLLPPSVNATIVTAGSIMFWINPPTGSTGKIKSYQIAVSSKDPNAIQQTFNKNKTTGNVFQLVQNLSPNTDLTVRVRSETETEWSDWSTPQTFRTKEGTPEAPVDLKVKQLNSTAIDVTWTNPEVTNGIITKYKLEVFGSSDVGGSVVPNYTANVSFHETADNYSTKVAVGKLSPGAVYFVAVSARTSAGYGNKTTLKHTMPDPNGRSIAGRSPLQRVPPPPRPLLVQVNNLNNSILTMDITINAVAIDFPYIPSYYEVVVYYRDDVSNIDLNETISIDNYEATARNKKPLWTAARILAKEFAPGSSRQFVLGDSMTYEGFYNGPLSSDTNYSVMLRYGDGEKFVSHLSPPMEITPVAEAPASVDIVQISSTSIEVVWTKPEVTNGVIINYRVDGYFVHEDNEVEVDQSYETANGTTTKADFKNLSDGMLYFVRVSARTKAGWGKTKSANITMTNFEKSASRRYLLILPPPPAPTLIAKIENGSTMMLNVTLHALSESAIFSIGYHEVIVVRHYQSSDEINLNDTDIDGYDITRRDELKPWVAARIYSEELPAGGSMQFIVGDNRYYDGYHNGPLSSTQLYAVMLRGGREYDYVSRLSSPMKSEIIQDPDRKEDVKGCVIWGISCVLFMVIVIVVVVLFWIIVALVILCRRNRRKKKLSITDGKLNNSGHPSNIWPKSAPDVDIANDTALAVFPSSGSSKTFNKNCNFFGPIPVRDLSEYISQRECNPKIDFHEEFKQAIRDKTKPWTVAKKPENLKKNRYGNILPYDMTRVRLEPFPGQPDTDYINASFVDGYDKPKVYIATQGPKENTFQDFWRMAWQENVAVIVMLTGLTENKKKKCDQYWPNHSRLYGNLLVTLTATEHLADLVIRHFELKTVEAAEIRDVTHYQYLDWPDLGLPPCVTSVLNLRRKVREEMQKRVSRSPIVVHCCGGAGRTGAFISIDAMLNQAYEEERVHVFKYVGVIWGNRSNLIQNVEQYRFVYNAVLEALQSGDTKVLCSRLPVYYRDICRTSANEPADLAEQYNILNRLERRQSCYPCPDALNDENTKKNRSNEILPVEHSRVRLQSIYEPVFEEDESREDCIPSRSDPYINAVLCDGFKQKGQFLVTHMPLDDTVQDFWRMVVLNRSSVIVMLNDCEFIDENTVPGQYWPNEGCMQFGPYQVEVVTFEELGMVTLRTLRVVDTRKINEFNPLRVSQLQFLDWVPDKPTPSSVVSVLALINVADVLRNKYGGPLTVHCQDGASRCGVFCASHVLKEQVETGEVDIFQTVKRLRRHRPQFITSIEQYQFCYEVAMASLSTADNGKDSSRLITLV